LSAIYEDAKTREGTHDQVKDITVEDPSPDFTFLRDVTDLRLCFSRKLLPRRLSAPLTPESQNNFITAVQNELKLSKGQILHLLEIIEFMSVDRTQDNEYTQFRLSVKRRLYKKYQDWLDGFAKASAKKSELQDMFEEVENAYVKVAAKVSL
jgi:hypothetical protein